MARLYSEDAELYDIAFDWDITDEVDWLVERLAGRSVLEPGCGSGRMLEALADRGLEVCGLDISPAMVELARARLRGRGEALVADMTEFDLGRTFDAALSPINTLLHLTPAGLAAHLDCMTRHTPKYLVQVGIVDETSSDPFAGSHWEATREDTTLKVDWVDEEVDFVRGRSRQRSRVEVLSGPRAGEILEETHDMTLWTPEAWARAIAASPYDEVATYDGGRKGAWPEVERTATGGLLWHLLERKGAS